MSNSPMDMDRYENAQQTKDFYESRNLDGYELLLCKAMPDVPEKLSTSNVVGIHLNFTTFWMDLYNKNHNALIKEYGTQEKINEIYGGEDISFLIDGLKKELLNTQKIGVEYVVFHVSEVSLEECFTFKQGYTDEEVVLAAADIINKATEDIDIDFYFLVENLWWAGLNFKSQKVTKLLLDKINYHKKGIMLDTGHLMSTNAEIQNEEEAVDYVLNVLENHKDLLHYIKGMHFHQSVSGKYIKETISKKHDMPSDYNEKMFKAMMNVFAIDTHSPFTTKRAKEIIDYVKPLYLTHEFVTSDVQEHNKKLDTQINAIGG